MIDVSSIGTNPLLVMPVTIIPVIMEVVESMREILMTIRN
jgi:hypothetical protein